MIINITLKTFIASILTGIALCCIAIPFAILLYAFARKFNDWLEDKLDL